MHRSSLALALMSMAACLASDDAETPDGGAHVDSPSGAVAVTVTAPTGATQVARDDLATDGSWVARVTYRAEVAPPSPRVDWMSGGVIRGTGLPPDYRYTASYAADGVQTLSAVVHGSGDAELGRADVTVTILPSTAESMDCHGKLAAIGVTFALGPDTMGIDDPVTVTLPLLGVAFASRASMVMDCGMALSFYRMVEVLVAHDVSRVTDGGSGLYNYRCVSGSESPPCTASGFSLHAEGKAYDIAQIQTGDGVTSSFGTDWMIDGGPTCNAVSASAPNQLLHDVVCDLYQNGVYTVLLTPNYQAAQDFVHMDLTAGQMLIK
jgi:hypothetical protein